MSYLPGSNLDLMAGMTDDDDMAGHWQFVCAEEGPWDCVVTVSPVPEALDCLYDTSAQFPFPHSPQQP